MRFHLRWAVDATARLADRVVYVSRSVASSFGHPSAAIYGEAGCDQRAKHIVIYNGIDVARVERVAEETRSAGHRCADQVLCVGRFVAEKGFRTAITAVGVAYKKRSSVRMTLIGEGPSRGGLEAWVSALGLEEVVTFLPWLDRDEILRRMAGAGVVMVPSDGKQEGFGLVAIEAFAIGTPVVLSRIPVFEEITAGFSELCYWAEPNNAESFAEAVERILGSPRAASERAATVREVVKTCFSSKQMARDYGRLYRSVAANRANTVDG